MITHSQELQKISSLQTRSGKELHVYRGYNDDVVGQLVKKSQESAIRERCPNDADRRFSSPEAFKEWSRKSGGRVLYPLLDAQTEELDGVIWLGAEKFTAKGYPGSDVNPKLALGMLMTDTYAIRTYESIKESDAAGRPIGSGIAKPFTRIAIADYATMRVVEASEHLPTFAGIHLETDLDNLPARRTYEHLGVNGEGFWPVAENEQTNRVAMALPLSRFEEVLGINFPARA